MKVFQSAIFLLAIFFPAVAGANVEEFLASLGKLSPGQRQQKLIEGAKKEGELMLYSSSGQDNIDQIVQPFTKKYPFLKTNVLRKGGSQLFSVALMEHRGGQHLVDVYWAGSTTVGPLVQQKGMLARYQSPERKAIPEEYRDKDGYWTATRLSLAIFAYHSKKVPLNKIPQKFEDLLDPFWKGNLSVDVNPASGWVQLIVDRDGWEKAESYLKKLATQDLKLHRGRTARVQLILAGEVLGTIDIRAENVVSAQKENAPLDYAFMNPSTISLTALAMPIQPPRPHAATLLYDYIISKEGQEMLARGENTPVRTDVQIQDPVLKKKYLDAKAKKVFAIESAGNFDPDLEEKFNRLYVETLVRKQ